MKRTEKEANKPWVSNYMALAEWLNKISAICNWQIMRGPKDEPQAAVECWTANGHIFIIQVYANKHGWEVFTATDTVSIGKTINDAEERLGLPKTFCFGGAEPQGSDAK